MGFVFVLGFSAGLALGVKYHKQIMSLIAASEARVATWKQSLKEGEREKGESSEGLYETTEETRSMGAKDELQGEGDRESARRYNEATKAFVTIEAGNFAEYELGLQVIDEKDELAFGFDLLDATKLLPEEVIPVRRVGRLTLNRNRRTSSPRPSRLLSVSATLLERLRARARRYGATARAGGRHGYPASARRAISCVEPSSGAEEIVAENVLLATGVCDIEPPNLDRAIRQGYGASLYDLRRVRGLTAMSQSLATARRD